MSRIIIGDIHGTFKTLKKLIEQFPKDVPITFVGDLIDRGNHSRDVVQYVIDNGYDCVMGNHEDFMIKAEHDKEIRQIWESNGGLRTLQSYFTLNENFNEDKFKEHREWMKKLPAYIIYDDCVAADGRKLMVSHAGINVLVDKDGDPWYDLPKEAEFDLQQTIERCVNNAEIMWHRDPIADVPGVYQVVGHTPIPDGLDITPYYANVDTGAVFKRDFSELYGKLTAIMFPEMTVFTQKNIED